MSDRGFSLDWLDLREPADHAARDAALLAQACRSLAPGATILDLGSGTGSTARAFAPLRPQALWRFLDGDAQLLSIAAARHPKAETALADLRDPESLPLDGVGLVTASALLDLMPLAWIEVLARRLSRARLPFYAALNYDGGMQWAPARDDDASITASFNRHQQSDKGLGPATGPGATAATKAAFGRLGYRVWVAQSPWELGPAETDLQAQLLSGIATAAQEAGHAGAAPWQSERLSLLPQATARIGHTDILAIPQ